MTRLAAGTVALAAWSCPTPPAVRTLQRISGSDCGLFEAATRRCLEVTRDGSRLRAGVVRLLTSAVDDLRRDCPCGDVGISPPAGSGDARRSGASRWQ